MPIKIQTIVAKYSQFCLPFTTYDNDITTCDNYIIRGGRRRSRQGGLGSDL